MTSLKGFTLIELLVVIAIIAILSVIGFAVVTNSTSRARDTQRKADINTIADALEHKKLNDPSAPALAYVSISGSDVSTGKIPKDPVTGLEYAFLGVTSKTGSVPADPTSTEWPTNPVTALPGGWSNASTTVVAMPTDTPYYQWKICARLENDNAGANPVYCRVNAQR